MRDLFNRTAISNQLYNFIRHKRVELLSDLQGGYPRGKVTHYAFACRGVRLGCLRGGLLWGLKQDSVSEREE